MFSLTLIRPGATDFDHQHRIQGALDLPLSADGESEIDSAIEEVRASGIEIIYSSPNEPALSTAQRLGEALQIPVKSLDGLSNYNLGLWQGLTIEEIKHKYPKVYKQWKEFPDRVCPPEGEDNSEALQRAMKALAKPLKRKIPFGLVVCEPLATYLSCSLRNCKHELPKSYCTQERPALVEQLEIEAVNGSLKATAISSS